MRDDGALGRFSSGARGRRFDRRLVALFTPAGISIDQKRRNHEIYVMNATGASPVRLTDNSSGDFQPSWSPGGEWIAFTSDRLGRLQIFLIRPDGSGERRLDL